MPLIYMMFVSPCDRARNSASIVEQATTSCFLLLHVIRFPTKNVQYLVVDL